MVAVTRRGNVASRRVMVSIGMRYEGEGRYYEVEGVRYAISREEFLQAAAAASVYILRRD